METLKDLQLEHMMVKHWAILTTQCLVLLIIPNFKKNLDLELMNQTMDESRGGFNFIER